MAFQKATRKQAKLKVALVGPSGSGKTYSSLLIAKGIGGKVAVIDTERGSASLYSHLVNFDVNELTKFEPEDYIEAIKEAVKGGYNTLVIDSLTHEWNETKQIAQKVGEAMRNDWAGWSKATPRHQALIDAILQSPIHVICTMRAKTEWAVTKDEKTGKSKPVKLGLGADQRHGVEYEFTTIFNISSEGHLATVDKDRTELFQNFTEVLSEDTGKKFSEWLYRGEDNPAIQPAGERRKAYVHVLLKQLDKKYSDEAVKARLQEITGKESMSLWTEQDVEVVIKNLDAAITAKFKAESEANKQITA
jgi:hypothetical protein